MALLDPISITGQLDDWDASGAAPGAWAGDAGELTEWGAAEYGIPTAYNPNFANDNDIEEETWSAYLQVELEGELGGMPTSTVIGVRYEDTDVTSVSAIAIPSSIVWISNNDFQLQRSTDIQPRSRVHAHDRLRHFRAREQVGDAVAPRITESPPQ